MFKDTPDGTTHSYEDGCGEPAHNKYCCDWQKQQPTLTVTIDGKCKCGYQYPIRGINPIIMETKEEVKNYAKSAWMNIPEGGRWRYEVENLSEGFEYFPQIAVVAKRESVTQ